MDSSTRPNAAARFGALLEHSHDAIAVVTAEGRTAYVSSGITRLTGRSVSDLIGHPTFEHVHPDDLELVRLSFADCLAYPSLVSKAEFRCLTQDGRWIYLEAVAVNRLDNPAINGVVVNVRDATERRAAEVKLQKARELLEATGMLAKIGGWEYFIPEDRLIWSEQTYRIHDLTPMSAMPTVDDAISFYRPDAQPTIRAAIERGLKTGEGWELILPFATATGRQLWVNAIGKVEFRSGRPYRLYGTFQDVTERIEAERAFARSESRYQNLFETAPLAIWEEDLTAIDEWFAELRRSSVTDLKAYLAEDPTAVEKAVRLIRVRDVNQAAVTMNRAKDKADLIANMHRLFTSESQAAFAAELIALWMGQRTLRLEIRSVRLNGEPADVVLHMRVPEVAGSPDYSRVVVLAVDATEQKSLEDQLRQFQKLEAVGRLAGGIAHDFNNLLTVINGFAELILLDAPKRSGIGQLAKHIKDAGAQAATLTRQLLAFSRKQPLSASLVDLAEIVGGLRPLLATLAGDDVRLSLSLGPVYPVLADRSQLEATIVNLCVNARDAMPRGGRLIVETSIVVDPRNPPPDRPPNEWVVLSVRDTGTGIPDAVRPHLFEPFFTTKEVGKGTGLGLSTAYGIVTTAGGHIRYETAVGVGTTFLIYLPAAGPLPIVKSAADLARVDGDLEARSQRAKEEECDCVQAKPLVLLVEDQCDVRSLSARVLQSAGYRVVEAENGSEALEKLTATPLEPLLLVTDVVMPRMNGRELADRVRGVRPNVAVLFVSGYAPEEVVTRESLADEAFLPKPFSPDELVEAVKALTASSS